MITFTIFRAETLTQTKLFLNQMFIHIGNTPDTFYLCRQLLNNRSICLLILSIILCYPIMSNKDITVPLMIFDILLLFLCLLIVASAAYNPFIYFRF